MTISNSPDITLLQLRAIFDLSVPVPVLRLENQSVGAHLANIAYAFEVYSPNSIPIHIGTLDAPDKEGEWVDYNISEAMPTFNQGIEWSGHPYTVQVFIRDSMGTIYATATAEVNVCAPAGNKKVGGNYGEGRLEVTVDCGAKEARIMDRTPYSYQGVRGKILPASSITILQPPDPSGVAPAPQPFVGYSQVAFLLQSSGEGFKAVLQAYVDYELYTTLFGPTAAILPVVRIKYIKTQNFDVNCNYDLCPLLYEYAKMLEKAETACDAATDRQIYRINALLTQAVIVKLQPTCGVDLGKLIDEIKDVAGWNCDCNCASPVGFNGSALGAPGELNIQFTTGGDITATKSGSGNNILLTIQDYAYIISVGASTTNRAFTVTPATNGRVKTFALNVNLDFLAADLIQKIGSVPALLDAFNALVRTSFNFTVDGKCVIASSSACDYVLTIGNIPAAPLTALFKSITIGGVVYPVNVSFSTTTQLPALKAALDGLAKGAFTVTMSGSNIIVSTTANQNLITEAVIFGAGSATDRFMNVSRMNCSGTISYSPSQIVQAIIDYLCLINATQVRLGYDFAFAKMKADGSLEQVLFKSTDSLKLFIDAVSSNAAIAISLGHTTNISFTSIRAIFDNKTNPIRPTDTVYGTRDGVGGQWTQTDIVKSLISVVRGTNDTAFLAEWCAAVNRCSTASACNPVVFAALTVRATTVDDFVLVGQDLYFVGFYNNHYINRPAEELGSPLIIHFTQVNEAGAQGDTATAEMNNGQNKILDVVATLPALETGYTWRITSIENGGSQQYMALAILNNGAPSYKVGIRLATSVAPFTYTTYPAQAGQYTRQLFAVFTNNYQASVIAVCGLNSQSEAITVANESCPAVEEFNALRVGNNFVVTYGFPDSVTQYNLLIQYPSGGSYNQVLTVEPSGQKTVPIPAGVFGEFRFSTRAVCRAGGGGWYGPTSAIVSIDVPAQATPIDLEVSNVQITTATATATPPDPVPGDAVAITLIITPVAGGAPVEYTQAPGNLVWGLTGLTASTQYNAQVRYEYAGGVHGAAFDNGNFTTDAVVTENLTVNSGWTDEFVSTFNVDTIELQQSQTISAGLTSLPVDFTPAPQYKTFIIDEPASEPVKLSYTNGLNFEPIPDFTFAAPVIKGLRRYYYTNGPVSFDLSGPVILKTT